MMQQTCRERSPSCLRRSRASVGLLLVSLASLLFVAAACGSDDPTHETDDHEASDAAGPVTDLVVVKPLEKGATLPEDLSERILGVDHVVDVEKYIRLRMEDFDIVGWEPRAPLRIMTGQPDVHLTEAQITTGPQLWGSGEPRSVLVGEVFARSADATQGETFALSGTDYVLRVAGEFSTVPSDLSNVVLMSLVLAQEIYDIDGMVTHFWVEVNSSENTHQVIRDIQLLLGESVDVLPRTYE